MLLLLTTYWDTGIPLTGTNYWDLDDLELPTSWAAHVLAIAATPLSILLADS